MTANSREGQASETVRSPIRLENDIAMPRKYQVNCLFVSCFGVLGQRPIRMGLHQLQKQSCSDMGQE